MFEDDFGTILVFEIKKTRNFQNAVQVFLLQHQLSAEIACVYEPPTVKTSTDRFSSFSIKRELKVLSSFE